MSPRPRPAAEVKPHDPAVRTAEGPLPRPPLAPRPSTAPVPLARRMLQRFFRSPVSFWTGAGVLMLGLAMTQDAVYLPFKLALGAAGLSPVAAAMVAVGVVVAIIATGAWMKRRSDA